jgi:hypothetical protein
MKHNWAQHLILAPIGFIIAMLIFNALQQHERDRLDALPASDWFEVSAVAIPDFRVGEDPPINYERVIKQPFVADWFVEINEVGTDRGALACQGNGANHYEPNDKVPMPTLLSWFAGTRCNLGPGQYQLFVTWQVQRDGIAAPVSVSKVSNVFRVLP